MQLNEHGVQNQIRAWCGEHDILAFRCNVGKVQMANGGWFDTGLPNGFSDLLLLTNSGQCIFCEVKDATGKQREDQIKFQKIIERRGFKYILAHSLEEFISKLPYYF